MSKPKSRIPEFKNYQEEAEFWDTHDFTDFMDELKPIKVKFAKNLTSAISVRLDPVSISELRHEAAKKGIGPTTLVRMWVLERLAETKPTRRTPPKSRAKTSRSARKAS